MQIAFIYDRKSFLPEIYAYKEFFENRGIEVITTDEKEDRNVKPDVVWQIMGFEILNKWKGCILIHEYTSASAPPWRRIKDYFKKHLNPSPHYRLFLNSYVSNEFNFKDNIPFGFRDMGVSIVNNMPQFIPDKSKIFDFIYLGNLHQTRQLDKLLGCFTTGRLAKHSLLILSKEYESMKQKFSAYGNIIFKGPVQPNEVAAFLRQARFGINFIPDIEPFNHQTSTKLLDYAANKVRVITTDYKWVRGFEKEYGGKFFYLSTDFSNFTWENINAFEFSFPEMKDWSWDTQIRKSGVVEFLKSKFPAFGFQSGKS